MIARKVCGDPRPVVHIQIDGLSVSREIQMRPHAATEMHIKSLAARCAEVGHSLEVGALDDPAAARARLKADQQNIVTAFCMQRSPALPVRNDVKLSAQIEGPGIKKTG